MINDIRAHMRTIRKTNTKPELAVRRLAHRLGFRFRLHRKELPGTPDLVFPAKGKVIFVHGCFWHQHPKCKSGRKRPIQNPEYWNSKLDRNVARDIAVRAALANLGWTSLIVWECEIKDLSKLATKLTEFLR